MNELVRQHLLRQAGSISRAQALAAGLTDRQVAGLLERQEWLRVHPGVFRLGSSVPLPETGLWAAVLWLGQKVLLADETAVWWWGVLPEPPPRWSFIGSTRCRSTPQVRVTRAFVDPRDRWRHRTLPVLSRPWAVLRAAAGLEARRAGSGIALIDRAKQQRAVRQADLERALGRHPGTHGSSTMRMLLDRTGDRAHSELERLAVSLLRRAGISGFEPNFTVRLTTGRTVEIDIAFPDHRIAIELDGYAFHSGAEAFRADLRRSNALMRDGWTIRRFSWDDLLREPDAFVAAVAELVSLHAP